MNTGQWPAIASEERMDITARVAAMNATVEAERKAMEGRCRSSRKPSAAACRVRSSSWSGSPWPWWAG